MTRKYHPVPEVLWLDSSEGHIPLTLEDGWEGLFTRHQAPGALPNGTRIEKCNSEERDRWPDGKQGTVIGSVYREDVGYFYFVEWDGDAKRAIGVRDLRIKPVTDVPR